MHGAQRLRTSQFLFSPLQCWLCLLINMIQNQAVVNLHGFKYVYKPRTINVSFSKWITRAWRYISPVKCFKKCCISTAVVGTDDMLCFQTRRPKLSCWATGLWSSVNCILVGFWPKCTPLLRCCTKCHIQLVKKAPVETDFLFWGLAVWRRLQMKSITCKVKNKVVPDSNFVAVLKF